MNWTELKDTYPPQKKGDGKFTSEMLKSLSELPSPKLSDVT